MEVTSHVSMRRRFVAQLGGLLLLSCADLEISHEAIVDFDEYPSTQVDVQAARGAEADTRYLVAELQRHSGFSRVEPAPALATTSLRVQLTVRVFSRPPRDGEIGYRWEWVVSAVYDLYAVDGELLASDGVNVIGSEGERSVRQRALDRIVVQFLPSYRY